MYNERPNQPFIYHLAIAISALFIASIIALIVW